MTNTPILVSFWGGPGAGKSTWALRLAHELKNRGHKAEYVPEMAKDYAWEKSCKFKYPTAPWTLIGGQMERLVRPAAQCDFVITDACPYMSSMYISDKVPAKEMLKNSVVSAHMHGYWTFRQMFDIFVDRKGHDWKDYGRNHTLEEAIELDKRQLETLRHELGPKEVHEFDRAFAPNHGYTMPLLLNDVFPQLYEFIVNQLTDEPFPPPPN